VTTENPLLLYLQARDRLDEEERALVKELTFRCVDKPAGTELVAEGSIPNASCLMMSGLSARVHHLPNGSRNISAIHVPGDFVDLHSFLLRPMDHGVITISDCTVCFLPHARLKELSVSHPHLTRLLWLSTLIDAAMHRRWLMAAGRLSASGRVAHFLCEMHQRLQVVELVRGLSFDLPMTQSQLGDAMGLSVVHVNRTLQELRQRQLIRWEGKTVDILDWHGLSEAGGFDPTYLNLNPLPR
jgi:CRP-like cAMP-binding protein